MPNPYLTLAFHARAWPHRLALVDDVNQFTYGQLDLLVRKVAALLAAQGVRPGDTVVTALPAGLDWIVTLALFHEACVSCANQGHRPLPPSLHDARIISLSADPAYPPEKLLRIDAAWHAALDAIAPAVAPKAYASQDALCRLALTSGTTGHARAVPLSLAAIAARLRKMPSYWTVARGELNLMPLCAIGGFMSALGSLESGDPYIPPAPRGLVARLRELGVRSLIGSPHQLANFWRDVQTEGGGLPALREIRSAGGPLSAALAGALRRQFGAEIINVYGSTEAGGLAAVALAPQHSPALAGYPVQGAEIQVVNSDDVPLPTGEEGVVRVRGVGMAPGYYRDEASTATHFRDGWFYPGDRGCLDEDGALLLAGRESEIINRGGVKVDPEAIDQLLQAWPGLGDGAAFAVDDGSGVTELAMALVGPADLDVEALSAALVAELGGPRVPRYYVFVEAVPRNAMGKVRRAELGQRLAAQLRQQRTV